MRGTSGWARGSRNIHSTFIQMIFESNSAIHWTMIVLWLKIETQLQTLVLLVPPMRLQIGSIHSYNHWSQASHVMTLSCSSVNRGVFNQGYLCSKCGLGAHKECLGRFGCCGKTGNTAALHTQIPTNTMLFRLVLTWLHNLISITIMSATTLHFTICHWTKCFHGTH